MEQLPDDILITVLGYCKSCSDYSAWSLISRHIRTLILRTWPRGPIDIPLLEVAKNNRPWSWSDISAIRTTEWIMMNDYCGLMHNNGMYRTYDLMPNYFDTMLGSGRNEFAHVIFTAARMQAKDVSAQKDIVVYQQNFITAERKRGKFTAANRNITWNIKNTKKHIQARQKFVFRK